MFRGRKKKTTTEATPETPAVTESTTAVLEPPAETPVETTAAAATDTRVQEPTPVELPAITPVVASKISTTQSVDSVVTEPMQATPVTTTSLETPAVEAPAANNAVAADNTAKPFLRTWVSDLSRGYSRTTDEDYLRLVVQFDATPPQEIRTALKDGGFTFQPNYRGERNAWVRRNDFEGRVQIDKIEQLVQELIPGRDSPSR